MSWIKREFMNFIHNFTCKHNYEFVRNIYGDEIIYMNGYRSVWKCTKCGHTQFREDLHVVGTLSEELDKLYDEYYKDKYKSWCEVHSETLNSIEKQMRERACKGLCWIDIVLNIDECTDDRNYYETWFGKNGLKYERECKTNVDVQIKRYEYHIRWKNR